MPIAGLDIFVVSGQEPMTLSYGRYFSFRAHLAVMMTRSLVDAWLAETEGKELSQYEDVLIEGEEDYGRMEWFASHVLKSLGEHPDVRGNSENCAVWGYLETLRDDAPVGVYWGF